MIDLTYHNPVYKLFDFKNEIHLKALIIGTKHI